MVKVKFKTDLFGELFSTLTGLRNVNVESPSTNVGVAADGYAVISRGMYK